MQITLHNFRCYSGLHHLQTINQDNLTLIKGKNGSGKSTLFLAIFWCLYGPSYLKGSQIKSLNPKKPVNSTYVELYFSKQNLRIKRICNANSTVNVNDVTDPNVAQDIINNYFGSEKEFNYVKQKEYNFLTLSNQEKYKYIFDIIFKKYTHIIDNVANKIKILKREKSDLEIKINSYKEINDKYFTSSGESKEFTDTEIQKYFRLKSKDLKKPDVKIPFKYNANKLNFLDGCEIKDYINIAKIYDAKLIFLGYEKMTLFHLAGEIKKAAKEYFSAFKLSDKLQHCLGEKIKCDRCGHLNEIKNFDKKCIDYNMSESDSKSRVKIVDFNPDTLYLYTDNTNLIDFKNIKKNYEENKDLLISLSEYKLSDIMNQEYFELEDLNFDENSFFHQKRVSLEKELAELKLKLEEITSIHEHTQLLQTVIIKTVNEILKDTINNLEMIINKVLDSFSNKSLSKIKLLMTNSSLSLSLYNENDLKIIDGEKANSNSLITKILSGGELDKLSIAIAVGFFYFFPKTINFLILDEVISSFDDQSKEDILNFLKTNLKKCYFLNVCHSIPDGFYDECINL